MYPVLEELSKIGIVPAVALQDAAKAGELAKALMDGGLNCAEVTFRTEAAEESIRIMAKDYPDMLVGAGDILTPEEADKAMAAGASFIASAGFNPRVVKHCLDKGYPVIPGTSNPGDVEIALEYGLDTVKFFPAEQAGGLKMIKAMCGPYTNVRFMPAGGINADNFKEYLDFPKIVACCGSWMVSSELIDSGNFDKIRELTKEAVDKMLGFTLVHVGINGKDEEEAGAVASEYERLFGFKKRMGNKSIFADPFIEVMKSPYLGANGHLAIGTDYMARAMYHLSRKGVEFDMSTAGKKEDGSIKAVYLKGEIGGFAIHLFQK